MATTDTTTRITLKKSHFNGKQIVLGPDFVSNGNWALRSRKVVNAAVFASEALAETIAPGLTVRTMTATFDTLAGQESPATTTWTTTAYLYESYKDTLRILSDGLGGVALINRTMLAVIGADLAGVELYGPTDGLGAFRDAHVMSEADALVMSFRSKDMPASPWTICNTQQEAA